MRMTLKHAHELTPEQILALDKKYLLRKQIPPFIISGAKNSKVFDVYGKEYIDFMGGLYGTNSVGWNRKEILDAMREQMKKLVFSHEKAPSETSSLLAFKLSKLISKNIKCLRACTGSEAVDLALKAARLYSKKKTIIAAEYCFHGQTYGGLSLEKASKETELSPLLPGIVKTRFPYPYREGVSESATNALNSIEKLLRNNSDIGSIILEPIQGTGAITPPDDYLRQVQKLCEQYSVLFILDEVITGFGRTGKLFAHQTFGVKPDILILGKSLSSGYSPIAATVLSDEVAEKFDPCANTSTFGWNPLSATAAISNIEIITKEKLWKKAKKSNALVLKHGKKLVENPNCGEIRGKGLFLGIELVKNKQSKEPCPELAQSVLVGCNNAGVHLAVSGRDKNVLIITPPLVISEEEIKQGLDVISNAIEKGVPK